MCPRWTTSSGVRGGWGWRIPFRRLAADFRMGNNASLSSVPKGGSADMNPRQLCTDRVLLLCWIVSCGIRISAHRAFLDDNIRTMRLVRAKLDTVVSLKPVLPSLKNAATIRAASEQFEGIALRNVVARLPSTVVSSIPMSSPTPSDLGRSVRPYPTPRGQDWHRGGNPTRGDRGI